MPRFASVFLLCAFLVAGVGVASATSRDFEHPASPDTAQQFAVDNVQRQDTPNDPGYDLAEPDDPDSTLNGGAVTPSTNLYDEQFGFFGFPSQRTRSSALYATGPNAGKPQISGFNAAGAWKLERGRPDVAIAILDTGIKWDKESLRLQIHLNKGELPVPKADRATPSSDAGRVPPCSQWQASPNNPYDANGDGVFNVLDYVCDSRVDVNAGPHGVPNEIDAEDLIATFGHCQIQSGEIVQCQRLRQRHRRLGLLRQRQRPLRCLELLCGVEPWLRSRRERR
ncbi:MAG: hypothetical protein E6G48_05120 [Actinobacteria bacterium]|nr:MAG: hypothetical protein E6G48_05120 [Actinomycetota bacterium]